MINPIDQFYPGLKIWVMFVKSGEDTAMLIFDREYSSDVPKYVVHANTFAMTKVNNLDESGCFYIPAMTSEQLIAWKSEGIEPPGYKGEYFVWKPVGEGL